MFIVTNTAEHNHSAPTHHSSLAGNTRPKPLNAETTTADDSIKLSSAKSVSSSDDLHGRRACDSNRVLTFLVIASNAATAARAISKPPWDIASYMPVFAIRFKRNRNYKATMATTRPENWDVMVGSGMGPGIGLQLWGTV
ncbi:hypothetical protein V6N13_125542 [Hibiscus sabdariffa]|uniref:Uncharacterized protein n=1 Tax=Hibiscus sabdariffa TaxID=183260 RepID=A0ABR2U686_9ROSI